MMGWMVGVFQRGLGAIRRIEEIQTTYSDLPGDRVQAAPVRLRGGVSFDNLSFSYPDHGRAVLDRLTLDVPPGTMVGICLRPEDIRVRDMSEGVPNRLAAKIEEIDFLGSFCRATLSLPAVPGVELAGDFSINLMRDFALVPGQPLAIAFPPDRLRVFAKP